MPNTQQGLDLQALKTDPNMWMRFAMPSKNGDYLESVFKDEENPFGKNNQAAVETLQKLAAEGKLYQRDLGRSRHFHKVEKVGEELKLGEQHEMKLSNRNAGPVLGLLMRMSRGYFKWIGLDGISNWFDNRLKQREAINKLEGQYKAEYKSLTSEQQAELKALRKHEKKQEQSAKDEQKALKKLDEAKALANESRKNLNVIRGKETTETLEELEAMLAQADQRAAENWNPEKEFARRALFNHEENLQKVGEARKDANEKKKTLDALRGKETTETLEKLEQMLSDADQLERRRGRYLNANERKTRKALREYVKSLRELEKTEKKAEGTKKKLDEALGEKTTETIEQLKKKLGINPEEANERNALRRHVENLRKLAQAEKKAEATKQKLDEFRSKNNPKGPKELESPLSKAPKIEDKTNTMQPTLMGDRPVQNQIPVPPKQDVKPVQGQIPVPPKLDVKPVQGQIPVPPKLDVNPIQNKNGQQEITGEKKEEQQQEKKTQLFIDGVEITEETAKQFPPHIVEAFKTIQQLINEAEVNKKENQPSQEQKEEVKENVQQPETQPEVKEVKQEEPATGEKPVVEEPQVTEETLQQQNTERKQQGNDPAAMEGTVEQDVLGTNLTQNEATVQVNEQTGPEPVIPVNQADEPVAGSNVPNLEMGAPLKDGADLEPEKINIQERHQDQAQMALQERLAAEREAMDSVENNWENRLANTLFSTEETGILREYYDTTKGKQEGMNFLSGAVCGVLATAAKDPESMKQIMEGLLTGKPLGNELDNLVNEGATAYNHAVEQITGGNPEPMEKLITNAALELGRQACRETNLSPRMAMIGRMISNAMTLADQNGVELSMDEEQWATVRGAFELSKLAHKHHNAKQFLGKEPMDMSSKEGRNAVRDLLLGNAVESMISFDHSQGREITNTQVLMGCGLMNVKNLTRMMKATAIQNTLTEEQVKKIMEQPNHYDSARLANQIGTALVHTAKEEYREYQENMQRDMQNEIGPEKEQQIEAMQVQPPQ